MTLHSLLTLYKSYSYFLLLPQFTVLLCVKWLAIFLATDNNNMNETISWQTENNHCFCDHPWLFNFFSIEIRNIFEWTEMWLFMHFSVYFENVRYKSLSVMMRNSMKNVNFRFCHFFFVEFFSIILHIYSLCSCALFVFIRKGLNLFFLQQTIFNCKYCLHMGVYYFAIKHINKVAMQPMSKYIIREWAREKEACGW